MMPISASTGVKEDGLSSLTNKFPLSIPERLKIHAVTVVPMFAPMMMLIACFSVMRPELTKPTTITVVAEELWITAVTPRPVRSHASLLLVNFSSRERSCPPARRSRACPIKLIPNSNKLRPPIKVSTLKISITFTPFAIDCPFILAARCKICYQRCVKSM